MTLKHYFLAAFLLLGAHAAEAANSFTCYDATAGCFIASPANRDISLGVVGSVSQSPYKKHDDYWMVAPLVLHDGQYVYFKGASAGFHLLKNEIHTISAGVSYLGLQFDPDDTDHRALRRLDKRRATLMADVSYQVITPIGLGKVKVARDVLGHSDGYTADLNLGVPLLREKFSLMPSLGVVWSSRKHSDYYFGIGRRESARSGLKRHTGKANFAPYLKVEAKYDFNDRWSMVAGGDVTLMTGSVKNSPMVGRDYLLGGFIGGTFNF